MLVKLFFLGVLGTLFHTQFSLVCSQTSLSVRLVDGHRLSEGRVEVFYNGQWGTVCDDGWGIRQAQVVCRMLGYHGIVKSFSKAHFGQGSGSIVLDDVICTGTESTLASCRHKPFLQNNCGHQEDAGVDCDQGILLKLPVRLAGGNNTREGRVEIMFNNTWGSVCIDYWGAPDAKVVCNQLGMNESLAIPDNSGRFGAGDGPVWMDDVACRGTEGGLGICAAKVWNVSNCRHGAGAGVVCLENTNLTAIRLVGGLSEYEGRVEVQLGGVLWGTVCDDSFGTPEAIVTCRMAGFSGGVGLTDRITGSRDTILLDDVDCMGTESNLGNCRHKAFSTSNCDHTEDIVVRCTPPNQKSIQIRLAGGQTSLEGRVEIFYKGQWGTVCDDLWGAEDATVVCRMLHLSTSGSVALKSPGGTGPIWLDDLRCLGTENSLQECPSSVWGQTNCHHNEDAGVRCKPAGVSGSNVTVRLVGGTNDHEGRVEINYMNEWGTVCDDYFTSEEAMVVCRMLGFPVTGAQAFTRSHFGRGTGRILLDDLVCKGTEPSLELCRHRAWKTNNCGHGEDAGVRCPGGTSTHTQVRLVGGTTSAEGRVEVYHSGQWGTVCDDHWSTKDAQVICRILHLPWQGAQPRLRAFYGQGNGSILLDEVKCNGTETDIADCSASNWGLSDCEHSEDAGVVCQQVPRISVRLEGGPDTTQGRVSIFYNNTWGTICDSQFDANDAAVICRMLGFTQPGAIALSRSFHGRGTGPVYFDGLECLGTESSILQCNSKGIGESISTCRSHRIDAGVKCNPQPFRVRLSGSDGTKGLLEVNILGQWDTVCDDSFNILSARVVCRMLGLSTANAQAVSNGRLGQGHGRIALDDVRCRGNETSLMDCRHSPLFKTNCGHSEDVGVICGADPGIPNSKVRLVNGQTSRQGRVEVFYNNTWGTVCDDGFTATNALVVCKWLKINAVRAVAVPKAGFHSGRGQIWLDDVVCTGQETDLFHCTHSAIGSNDCRHSEDVGVTCYTSADLDIPVRLQNGTSNSGRVEVFYNNHWGTVCDDSWGTNEAKAVCRKLGLPSNFAVAIPNAYYGEGQGNVTLDDVECNGTEPSITYCDHKVFGENDCDHTEDAGVMCLSGVTPGPVKVSLAGGLTRSQGRVQILYGGIWGTISKQGFHSEEANVICRMLGYSRGGTVMPSSRVGSGTGPIWLDQVNCRGNETNIADCPRKYQWGESKTDAGHGDDAGVICLEDLPFNFTVRLVNSPQPHEGRLEVFYNNSWGTVCDDSFGTSDAAVVCSMLGYGTDDASAVGRAQYGRGTLPIVLDDVKCVGTETNLAQCQFLLGKHNCDHGEDVGVICNPAGKVETSIRVRLVGGENDYSGRVEVFYNNTWGTVCDDNWVTRNAKVVCRMLNKPTDRAAARTHAAYGQGRGKIWLDDVNCVGTEASLTECRHRAWGSSNCGHREDAGVECPGATRTVLPMRLVGTAAWEGRVEVFYNNQWGVVCDDGFGPEEAQVVCREMGFPTAGATAHTRAFYGRGTGVFVFDDVVCAGTESDIDSCRHLLLGHNNCKRGEEVGVSCPAGHNSSVPTIRLVGGPTPNQGRVEVYVSGSWGTVCDDSFDHRDAEVACAMLGFERTGASAVSRAHFGRGSGTIWFDDMACSGQETSLFECAGKLNGRSNCNHGEDVGVICRSDELSIRLVGGSTPQEGRVELNVNGTWGTICDDLFSANDARVICRMLSLPTNSPRFYGRAHYGRGTGPIYVDNLRCTGSETTILSCSRSALGQSDCQHTEDVGVSCYDVSTTRRPITVRTTPARPTPVPSSVIVRLVGGVTPYEGRVELMTQTRVGTVCDQGWTDKDAGVICSMLGYTRVGAVAKLGATYGQGTSGILMSNATCRGNERYIAQCPGIIWDVHECGHQNDAGVSCSSSQRPDNFLVVVNYHYQFIRMDLGTYSYVNIPHDNHRDPMFVDYDPVEARLYWSDSGIHEIRSSNLDGSDRKTLAKLDTRSTLGGVAVDSISRNLYYADRSNDIIGMMSLDGNAFKSLITGGLSQPRDVAIHTGQRLLFWTDYGHYPKIERSNLDGTDRRKIINSTIRYPMGITVDYRANKIYWCDTGVRKIQKANLDGSGQESIYYSSRSPYFFGIAVDDTYVYYTSTYTRSVVRMSKTGADRRTIGTSVSGQLRGILVQKRGVGQTGTNACSQGKGGCSYLCAPTGNNGKVCLCPDGLILQKDGVTCSKNVPCKPLRPKSSLVSVDQVCLSRSSAVGTICNVTCGDGYSLSGPDKITCLSNGVWSNYGNQLSCIDTQAPNITCPKDISLQADRGTTLAIAKWSSPIATDNSAQPVKIIQSQTPPVSFQEGTYTVFVSATDISGLTATCSFTITVTVQRCQSVNLPAHAYVSGSYQNYLGARVNVLCQDGYKLVSQSDQTQISCELNNGVPTWTTDISCTAITCSALTTPANAVMSGCTSPLTVGSVCSLSCGSGYRQTGGTLSRQCLPDGSWTGQDIVCSQETTCQGIITPTNGALSCSPPYTTGTICVQSCAKGFSAEGGTVIRQCQDNGQWSGTAITCNAAKTCKALSTPANGQLTGCMSPYNVGATCRQQCMGGFDQTDGTNSRICQMDGTWSGSDLTCSRAVTCAAPEQAINGQTSGCESGSKVGSVCIQSCNRGYMTASGSPLRLCTPAGTWSGERLNCTKVLRLNQTSESSAQAGTQVPNTGSDNTPAVIILAVLVALLFVAGVIAGLYYFKRRTSRTTVNTSGSFSRSSGARAFELSPGGGMFNPTFQE